MSRTHHHGSKAKARTFGKNERWLSQTPGWWVRLMMTRPQRRRVKLWERDAAKRLTWCDIDDPPHGRKPHHYFW